MQIQSINSIIFSTLMIFLTACGGEDAGTASGQVASSSTVAPTSTTPPVSTVPPVVTVPSYPFSIADSGPVEGLGVECSLVESKTLSNGSFECLNFPLSVYIGDYKIGELQQSTFDNTIYIQDLLGVPRGATAHSEVTKISMILQSLDEDAQPLNGITLTDETLSLLNAYISSTTNLAELSFEDIDAIIEDVITSRLIQNPNSQLRAVDYITAQSNLTTKIAELPALTYVQRTTEG